MKTIRSTEAVQLSFYHSCLYRRALRPVSTLGHKVRLQIDEKRKTLKLNISLRFIKTSNFKVMKTIRYQPNIFYQRCLYRRAIGPIFMQFYCERNRITNRDKIQLKLGNL